MYEFNWIQRTAQWTAQATASKTPPLPDKETTKMDETKSVVPTPLMILKFEWNNVDRYLAYSCIVVCSNLLVGTALGKLQNQQVVQANNNDITRIFHSNFRIFTDVAMTPFAPHLSAPLHGQKRYAGFVELASADSSLVWSQKRLLNLSSEQGYTLALPCWNFRW